mgnify:FL=1
MPVPTTDDEMRSAGGLDEAVGIGPLVATRPTFTAVPVAVIVAVLLVAGPDPHVWLLVPALALAAAVAAVDAVHGRLPDPAVALVALVGLVGGALFAGAAGIEGWVTGAIAGAAPMLVLHLVSPCAMGFGDVKFASALGGVLGSLGSDLATSALMVTLALALASALALIAGAAVRRCGLAFGPWLFLGASIAFVLAATTGVVR